MGVIIANGSGFCSTFSFFHFNRISFIFRHFFAFYIFSFSPSDFHFLFFLFFGVFFSSFFHSFVLSSKRPFLPSHYPGFFISFFLSFCLFSFSLPILLRTASKPLPNGQFFKPVIFSFIVPHWLSSSCISLAV